MKRTIFFAAICILANTFLYAQELSDYGVLSNEEINLKHCDFDKDASAVVLLHEAYSTYDDEHRLITTHHVRVKILKENGFPSANVSIPFYRKDDFEFIDRVEGMTINFMNGKKEESVLERKSIFTQKNDERLGHVVFAFPAIHAGSIIEYKYRSIMKHYGGLEDWNFQEELPVLVSKYTLIILPNMEFAYRVNKAPEIPITVKQQTGSGGVYFEMRNIPGLGDEPFMDARRDYLQKVIFQLSGYGAGRFGQKKYMTSWDEVTRELLMSGEFGSQLNKNITGTDEFIKQVKSLGSAEEKMKTVFNYIRANMNWNGYYSKYSIDGVKEAWQKKTGTSADINLVLVNLLREAGLETYPMLVSERFHGKVDKAYPFIDQFNSVFACVIIAGRKYYLDATDKTIPAHLTPNAILNTTAFIVNRKAGGLINITNDSAQYSEYISAQLELAENGTLSGNLSVRSIDYAREKKVQDYKADKNKFLNKYFIVEGTTISGKDLAINNLENDSLSFLQECKVSGQLNTTGEYSFLPLNLFTGFNSNPFLSDNRFSNINFGYRRAINLNVTVQLPKNYVVDEIPKSLKLTNPDNDITFIRQLVYNKENNSVQCMLKFEFLKSLYETDTYPMVKEMYQKLFDYLKEPVVLKKK